MNWCEINKVKKTGVISKVSIGVIAADKPFHQQKEEEINTKNLITKKVDTANENSAFFKWNYLPLFRPIQQRSLYTERMSEAQRAGNPYSWLTLSSIIMSRVQYLKQPL